MKTSKDKISNQNLFMKMVADKKAISECIKKKGNLKELSNERGIKFATPV